MRVPTPPASARIDHLGRHPDVLGHPEEGEDAPQDRVVVVPQVLRFDLKLTWFVGVDWGSQKHQACVLDAAGKVLGERAFEHGGVGLSEMGAALLRWRPNQSLRRRRGRRQLDPSRRGEERRRVRWPTVLLSSATDGGLPLVLARFVRGLSTHQGSGCPRRLRTAATAAKCHRAPVDSHRVADQMPTGPSMSRRRAPHAASPLPRG